MRLGLYLLSIKGSETVLIDKKNRLKKQDWNRQAADNRLSHIELKVDLGRSMK